MKEAVLRIVFAFLLGGATSATTAYFTDKMNDKRYEKAYEAHINKKEKEEASQEPKLKVVK